MKRNAALEAYVLGVPTWKEHEEGVLWWWRLALEGLGVARHLWSSVWRRLAVAEQACWRWYARHTLTGVHGARRAVAAAAGALGMPPLPPRRSVGTQQPRGWGVCKGRAVALVESGAALCTALRTANRLRRATAALDLCASSPAPPNLAALPLDRAATARWSAQGGPRRETITMATEACDAALKELTRSDDEDDESRSPTQLAARVVAAAAEGLDLFASGDDAVVERLDVAATAIDDARLWLGEACSASPAAVESPEAKALRAVRERLELAAAAAFQAELALASGDRRRLTDAKADASKHANAALEGLREDVPAQAPASASPILTSPSASVVIVRDDEDREEDHDFVEPPHASSPVATETLVFAAEASAEPPILYQVTAHAPDHRDLSKERDLISELQRALSARSNQPVDHHHDDDDDDDDDVVVVAPPTTQEVSRDPRYARVTALLNASFAPLKKTASEPVLARGGRGS